MGRNKRIEEIKSLLPTRVTSHISFSSKLFEQNKELDNLFDTREVLREGSLKMLTSKKKAIDAHIILMPDTLLVLKLKNKKFEVKAICPINLILIQDIRNACKCIQFDDRTRELILFFMN